jgi:hypothetical protein
MAEKSRFRDIIDGAKRKHEDRLRTEAEQRKRDAAERERRVDAGIHWLKTVVRPLLEEAKLALAAEKIEIAIVESFDVQSTPHLPDISFQCVGAKRRGSATQPHSYKYWVRADGESFEIGTGSDYASAPQRLEGRVKIDARRARERLEDAICAAIESYYASLGGER